MEFPLLTHEPSVTRSDRFTRRTRPINQILGVQFQILRAKKGPRLDLCVRLPSGRRANVVRTRWFARFNSDVGSRQPTQTSPKYQQIRKEQAFQILFCSLFAIFRTNTQDHLGRSRPSDIENYIKRRIFIGFKTMASSIEGVATLFAYGFHFLLVLSISFLPMRVYGNSSLFHSSFFPFLQLCRR